MNTIYTTNIIVYGSGDAVGELCRSISHEFNAVDCRPGRLRRKSEPLAGGDTVINGGFVTSSEVVNKYMPDSVAFTVPGMTHTSYISYNEEITNEQDEGILMK